VRCGDVGRAQGPAVCDTDTGGQFEWGDDLVPLYAGCVDGARRNWVCAMSIDDAVGVGVWVTCRSHMVPALLHCIHNRLAASTATSPHHLDMLIDETQQLRASTARFSSLAVWSNQPLSPELPLSQ